jgi:hypothetical protein
LQNVYLRLGLLFNTVTERVCTARMAYPSCSGRY